jgi:pterin-4a-carbinolamine dehydratase
VHDHSGPEPRKHVENEEVDLTPNLHGVRRVHEEDVAVAKLLEEVRGTS